MLDLPNTDDTLPAAGDTSDNSFSSWIEEREASGGTIPTRPHPNTFKVDLTDSQRDEIAQKCIELTDTTRHFAQEAVKWWMEKYHPKEYEKHERYKDWESCFIKRGSAGRWARKMRIWGQHKMPRTFTTKWDKLMLDIEQGAVKEEVTSPTEQFEKTESAGTIFSCDKCSYKSATKASLKNHTEKCHTEATIKCDECSTLFPSLRLLRNHKKTKHHPKPYPCHRCEKGFMSKSSLQTHILALHENYRFRCDLCDTTFAQESSISLHKKLMHGVNMNNEQIELKLFKCDVCSQTFRLKRHLKIHVDRIHRGLRDFHCDFCEKRFYTRVELIRHKRRHTGEKPFICTYCDGRFKQSESRNLHCKSYCKVKKSLENSATSDTVHL